MVKWTKAGLLISGDELNTEHGKVITAMHDEIVRLREFVLSFPCTCWINKPKCVVCQVKEEPF